MQPMAQEEPFDLYSPAPTDIVLEVRSGKIKNLKGLNIKSGIDKTLCHGPVKVSLGGIDGDEHDYTVRGRQMRIRSCPPP